MIPYFLIVSLSFAVGLVSSYEPPKFFESGSLAGGAGCFDSHEKCAQWATDGECQSNAAWMMISCKKSCQSCQGGDNGWKLRAQIARNYNSTNDTKKYNYVNRVLLKSLDIHHLEIGESSQIVKMHGKMVLTWNDSKVAWDKNQWNVSWLTFYWLQLWTPTVVQSNAPTSNPAEIHSSLLAANYTGQVYMWADFTFSTMCDFDYTYYPFDTQTCCYELDDKQNYLVKLTLGENVGQEASVSAKVRHPAGWLVDKLNVSPDKRTSMLYRDWNVDPFILDTSNVDICVTIRRDSAYVSAQVIGPALTPAIVTLISFVVGDYTKQIYVLISSMALQIISMIPLIDRMPPPSGETPSILRFCSFNMTMTCVSIIVAAILLGLSTRESNLPAPRFVAKFVWLIEKVCPCLGESSEEDVSNIVENHHENNTRSSRCTYAPLARALKCLFFIATVFLYIFVSLGCFAR